MDSGSRTPPLHRWLDLLSGTVLMVMIVWAPWAFGSTTSWARWTLCGLGYALGVLLVAKQVSRLRTGVSPSRWVQPTPIGRWATRALAGLTLIGLEFLLASWVNARASIHFGHRGVDLIYHERPPVPWLPTSYDSGSTLQALILCGAVASVFWAARDWLLGRSKHERRAAESMFFPPDRMRWLLWTLCLSSTALALVSIAQRLEGTDRLLWLLRTPIFWQRHPNYLNPAGQSWGPFPAHAVGTAYFNLVWPVALGFWWSLRASYIRRAGAAHRIGGDASIVLIPCILLMAACPWVAGGRSGAMVALGQLGACLLVLAAAQRPNSRWKRPLTGLGGVFLIALGSLLVYGPIQQRFLPAKTDALDNRTEVQEVAARMASDAGWLGTGAGSFAGLYPLYRSHAAERWITVAHNDWMEIRITLGWLGLGLTVLMLLLLGFVWKTGCGPRTPWEFPLFIAIALSGALLQAAVEFPFQVPSIFFLFLLLAAVALATPGTRSSVEAR